MTEQRASVLSLAGIFIFCGCGGGSESLSVSAAPVISSLDGVDERSFDDVLFELRLDLLEIHSRQIDCSAALLERNPFSFSLFGLQRSFPSMSHFEISPDWSERPPVDSPVWSDATAFWPSTTTLVLIGIIEAPVSVGRVAVLTDGETVYHGQVGDMLGSYARIVSITPPFIELQPSGRARYTLSMAQ